jgi:predicted AAA+ superfamily ATPase
MQHDEIKTAQALYEDVKRRLAPEGRTYLFFDEIQEVISWETAIASLMADFDVDIYVTGSNARVMSPEVSESLEGKIVVFRVFPLSFGEYLDFHGKRGAPDETRYAEFERYLKLGGFPAVHLSENSPDEAYPIVRDIYASNIYTDIVRHSQIRKAGRLEHIVKFIFDNVGKIFAPVSIIKYLRSDQTIALNKKTVYDYLAKLENAFILHRCPRYNIRTRVLLKIQEKYYLGDPALRWAVRGFTPDGVSAALENVVYIELRRRGYEVYVGKIDSAEISFVATRRESKLYVQIARKAQRGESGQRQHRRPLGIKDSFPKYILRSEKPTGDEPRGVRAMHMADFLLCEDY